MNRVAVIDGVRKIEVKSGRAQTRREAERQAAVWEAKKPAGRSARTDVTVADWMDAWLAEKAEDLRVSTLVGYRDKVETHIRPTIGDIRVSRLTVANVEEMLRGMVNRKDPTRPLAKATRHQTREILSGALRHAMRSGIVDTNVARLARPPKGEPKRRMMPPTTDLAKAALDAAREISPTAELLVHLALHTGARRGELVELRWSDVDWDAPSITISRSCTVTKSPLPPVPVEEHLRSRGRPASTRPRSKPVRTSHPTKTGSVRPIPITQTTIELLRAQRATIEAYLPGAESPWVLSDEPGVPWSPERAGKTWVRVRTPIGLDNVRLHDLRHFVATQLLAGGMSAREVAERLGHADASMTLRVYAHATDMGAQRATDMLDRLLS